MNKLLITKYIVTGFGALALIVVTLMSARVVDASVVWANGNLGYGAQAGSGSECPAIMIGNYTTQEGIISSGFERCWASSISDVEPGETFNLLVKFKNAGTSTATSVKVRVVPASSGVAVSSRSYTATISGVDGSSPASISESVSVNISSPQTITAGIPKYYPSPYSYSNSQNIISSQLSSSMGYSVSNVTPGNYCYIIVPFTVGNNGGNQGQAPIIQTQSPSDVTQSSVVLRGACTEGPLDRVWFDIKEGSDTYSLSQQNQTTCSPFSRTFSLPQSDLQLEYRACGSNQYGQSCGNWVIIGQQDPVNNQYIIDTLQATSVDTDSATLNGEISQGNGYNTVWFTYSNIDATPECQNGGDSTTYVIGSTFNQGDQFSKSISNLMNDERYYYRACGTHNAILVSGNVEQFITNIIDDGSNNGNLDIETLSASNVDEDSATLRGEIIDGNNYTSAWFSYSRTDTTPECENGGDTITYASGYGILDQGDVFTRSVMGLVDNENYYYRACGYNNGIKVSGDVESFDTDSNDDDDDDDDDDSDDLDIETLSASNVDEDSATLRGEITQGDNYDDVWFVYSRSDSTPECDGNSDDEISVSGNDWDEDDAFSRTASNLNDDTKYYYRACGEKDNDTVSGNVRNFTTDDEDGGYIPQNNDDEQDPNFDGIDSVSSTPIIQTLTPTNVTSSTAIANGVYNANSCSSFKTYFRLGTNANTLNIQTAMVTRGNSIGVARENLSNLAQGTSYYIQFIGVCGSSVYYGDIEKITTTGARVIGTVATTQPIVTQPLASNEGNGCLGIHITDDVETVEPGQYVSYRIDWENACSNELEDATLKVILPNDSGFLTTSRGLYTGSSEHSIILSMDTIEKDSEDFMIVNTQVKTGARSGDLIVAQVDLGGSQESDGVSSTAFDVDKIIGQSNTFGASAFGSGFFNRPLGWIISILILGLIGLAARTFYMAGAGSRNRGVYYPPVMTHTGTPVIPQQPQPQIDSNAYTVYHPKPMDPEK